MRAVDNMVERLARPVVAGEKVPRRVVRPEAKPGRLNSRAQVRLVHVASRRHDLDAGARCVWSFESRASMPTCAYTCIRAMKNTKHSPSHNADYYNFKVTNAERLAMRSRIYSPAEWACLPEDDAPIDEIKL